MRLEPQWDDVQRVTIAVLVVACIAVSLVTVFLLNGCGHEQEIIDTLGEVINQVGKDTPTPSPTETPVDDNDAEESTGIASPAPPVLVATPTIGKVQWMPGFQESSESFVRQYTGGKDKGSPISFVAVEFTNLTTGQVSTVRWEGMWNGKSPKPWDNCATTPHYGSAGTAQNWSSMNGHTWMTWSKKTQPTCDGTCRGYVWVPVAAPKGQAFKVRVSFKSAYDKGSGYYTLIYQEADGTLKAEVYYQSQRSDLNKITWSTISESFVFYR